MLQIDTIRGNVGDDPDLADAYEEHAAAGTLERIEIDSGDRVKSRLRTETDAGTDVGLVVDRPELSDGDVLTVNDDRMIVVSFSDRESLVVSLPSDLSTAATVELGHRIGNQHWDFAVSGGELYVPLAADRRIVENVVGDALPGDCETRVESVDASLFVDDESSLRHEHSHGPDGTHSHENQDGHSHDHTHEHGDGHSHDHSHTHEHAHSNADGNSRSTDHEHSHESEHAHSGDGNDHSHGGES